MSEKNNETEDIFIGARVLSDKQLEMTLPNYESIYTEIKTMRKAAKINYDARTNSSKGRGSILSRQYNQTFGIFGSRGTGKSSALYTIIDKLKTSQEFASNYNIVLKTIEPDNFGNNTKILGAFLGALKDVVDDLNRTIKKSENRTLYPTFFKGCLFIENNSLEKAFNEALEYYCYTEDEYRKILTSSFVDMETFKKKYTHVLNPDVKLVEKLHKLIDEIVSVKLRMMNTEDSPNNDEIEMPMLFIVIDDIDLKTVKAKELIESVMQYTCHPNVICFLSGDYELLKEAITLSLIGAEPVQDMDLLKDKQIFDNGYSVVARKYELSNEYLKKIIPPAFRFKLVKWNVENIPYFYIANSKNINVNEKYFYKQLENVFGENNFFVRRRMDNNKDVVTINPFAFEIFDKTARGLINVYYMLDKVKFETENNVEKPRVAFEYAKSLIDTIIGSSSTLVKFQNEIDGFIKWGSGYESSILDYQGINAKLEEVAAVNGSELSFTVKMESYQKYSQILTLLYTAGLLIKARPDSDFMGKINESLILIDNALSYSNGSIEDFNEKNKQVKVLLNLVPLTTNYNSFQSNQALRGIINLLTFEDFLYFKSAYSDEINLYNKKHTDQNRSMVCTSYEDREVYELLFLKATYKLIFAIPSYGQTLIDEWYTKKYENSRQTKYAKALLQMLKNVSSLSAGSVKVAQNFGYLNTNELFRHLDMDLNNHKNQIVEDEKRCMELYDWHLKGLVGNYFENNVCNYKNIAAMNPAEYVVRTVDSKLTNFNIDNLNCTAELSSIAYLEDIITKLITEEEKPKGMKAKGEELSKLRDEYIDKIKYYNGYSSDLSDNELTKLIIETIKDVIAHKKMLKNLRTIKDNIVKAHDNIRNNKAATVKQFNKSKNIIELQFKQKLLALLIDGNIESMTTIDISKFAKLFYANETKFYDRARDGSSSTNYYRAFRNIDYYLGLRKEIKTNNVTKECISISNYINIKDILSHLGNSASWYGVGKANEFRYILIEKTEISWDLLDWYRPLLSEIYEIKELLGLNVKEDEFAAMREEFKITLSKCEEQFLEKEIKEFEDLGIEDLSEEVSVEWIEDVS